MPSREQQEWLAQLCRHPDPEGHLQRMRRWAEDTIVSCHGCGAHLGTRGQHHPNASLVLCTCGASIHVERFWDAARRLDTWRDPDHEVARAVARHATPFVAPAPMTSTPQQDEDWLEQLLRRPEVWGQPDPTFVERHMELIRSVAGPDGRADPEKVEAKIRELRGEPPVPTKQDEQNMLDSLERATGEKWEIAERSWEPK